TVEPLRFTETMFRIEAARLPEATRQVFASLTSEIDSVQSQVRETFSERFRLVANTRRGVDEVVATVRAQSGRLDEMVDAKKAQIAESLEKLRLEIDLNAGRDIRLTSTSRAIAS